MAQTKLGQAVYRLRFGLRVPSTGINSDRTPVEKAIWLPEGYEASESELSGLVLPPLVAQGALEQVKESTVHCLVCEASGTKADAKKTYTAEELAKHYGDQHPGYTSTEEV